MAQNALELYKRIKNDPDLTPQMPQVNALEFNRPVTYYNDGMSMDQILGKDPAPWGYRNNGEPKGRGFLGVLNRPDGGVSTELSMSDTINGRNVDYPALVPTLSKNEIDWLLTHEANAKMPVGIADKAYNHAMDRINQGSSPFATEQEMRETDPALFQFIR